MTCSGSLCGRSGFVERCFVWIYCESMKRKQPGTCKKETHNAQIIREGKSKEERFQILKEIVDYQMQILSVADKIACIEEKNVPTN